MSERGRVTYPDGTVADLGSLEIEVECPCGQLVAVYQRGILHKEPRCSDFEDRDPVLYLRWVRKHHEEKLRS